MRIIDIKELHSLKYDGPFYTVLDKDKQGDSDPRACGCAGLALLNSVLFLKESMKIHDGKTIYDELKGIQELTKEHENSVRPENMLDFIDKHPVFNSCRLLVMNPNGMIADVFLRIFLRRLAQGCIAIVMMEVPVREGDAAKNVINHASFIHSKDGEVYFDGLRVDLNFLIRAFYFSSPTTLLVFDLNRERNHE